MSWGLATPHTPLLMGESNRDRDICFLNLSTKSLIWKNDVIADRSLSFYLLEVSLLLKWSPGVTVRNWYFLSNAE